MLSVLLILFAVLATVWAQRSHASTSASTGSGKLDALLEKICSKGELEESLPRLRKFSNNAAALHSLSALETILHSNITGAVALHRQAKQLSPTTIPPLAQMHLNGRSCGGLADLFFITAVIIKQMVDSNIDPVKWQEALTTLITLTADSGLHKAAETHLQTALSLAPDDSPLLFRAALMTPGVFESIEHLHETREKLRERVETLYSLAHIQSQTSLYQSLSDDGKPLTSKLFLKSLDEFVLSPTFYFIYQGYGDREVLRKLQAAYAVAYPLFVQVPEGLQRHMQDQMYWHQQPGQQLQTAGKEKESAFEGLEDRERQKDRDTETGGSLSEDEEFVPSDLEGVTHEALAASSLSSSAFRSLSSNTSSLPLLRVGFVSSHFRRHSICKLYCGLMTNLDRQKFEVFVFSSLSQDAEDEHTQALRRLEKEKDHGNESHFHYVPIGKTFVQNRHEVTDRRIDVLIYLDVGMDPSTTAWAAARLAPVQMSLWGHPSTSGLPAIDYFLSSSSFHTHPFRAASASDSDSLSLSSLPYLDKETERERDIERQRQRVGEKASPQSFFLEQLVQFEGEGEEESDAASLGFHFVRPSLQHVLSTAEREGEREEEELLANRPSLFYERVKQRLLSPSAGAKALLQLLEWKQAKNGRRVFLCPQHMPKFHPELDKVLMRLLVGREGEREGAEAVLVLIDQEKKSQWRKTLTTRWEREIHRILSLSPSHSSEAVKSVLSRVLWMPSLSPEEYLLMLSLGDIMLDPYPFGGGVTTLESLAVCTPVLTLPARQNVPQLAAGMIRALSLPANVESLMILSREEDFEHNIEEILGGGGEVERRVRGEICERVIREQRLFSDVQTVRELERFLLRASKALDA